MKTTKLFCSVLFLSTLNGIACGGGSFSNGDDGVPPANVTGGGSGNGNAAPDASVPANCDVTATPAADACVVNETLGIFVQPPSSDAGSDAGEGTANGTRGNPYTKMQDAIDAAKAQKKRVYACIGNYAEQITLEDGVSIFGDLDCNHDWNVVPTHAALKALASPAARADKIVSPTRIDSLDMIAPDATTAGGSSIALIANASPALTVANATIHGGNGMNGADGVEGIQLTNSATFNGANGVAEYVVNATNEMCGSLPATTNVCVGAAGYQGGAGGAGGWGGHWVVSSGGGGFASTTQYQLPSGAACLVTRPCVCSASNGNPQPASATTAQGGAPVGGADPGNRPGAAGAAGTSGTTGADGAYAFNAETGFVAGDGVSGSNGGAGQGGGGGMGIQAQPGGFANGTNVIGTGGAGGGAGGCPGLAGTPGGGGGASIAIIAIDSPFAIISSVVESSTAGDGGHGTFGSAPTFGGDPGANLGTNGANAGGSGGAGGVSGWSGSGAGAPSFGIVSHGAAVVLTKTTPTAGAAGHGVAAMTSGTKTIPASPDGTAALTATF